MIYRIYYKKGSDFQLDPLLEIDEVISGDTYTFVREEAAANLDELYVNMQEENWSPNEEAKELIETAGTNHISMSVGDVAVAADGKGWQLDALGWVPCRVKRANTELPQQDPLQ